MPSTLQGLVSYPGIVSPTGGTITLGHGVSAQAATIDFAPQQQAPAATGTLKFTFGNVTLEFPDCRLDEGSLQVSGGGWYTTCRLFDRRWKWEFATISGFYNHTLDSSSLNILLNEERTPQQLATILFRAMGEQTFDVSALPNAARPQVDWDGALAAPALADLCEQLDCRVVMGLDNIPRIVREGIGQQLDTEGMQQFTKGIKYPKTPDRIRVEGDKIRVQVDLPLEAVGEDADNTIKPVDSLSYKPDVGWTFGGGAWKFFEELATDGLREHAMRSVGKWFRVKLPFSVWIPFAMPEVVVTDHQLYDIEDARIELVRNTVNDDANGTYRRAPAIVYGKWCDLDNGLLRMDELRQIGEAPDVVPTPLGTLPVSRELSKDDRKAIVGSPDEADLAHVSPAAMASFSIDRKNKIVKFGGQVLQVNDDGNYAPAELVLRCTVTLREPGTKAWMRFEKMRTLKPGGVVTRTIRHEDIGLQAIQGYSNGNFNPDSVRWSNLADVQVQANYYLDLAEQQYARPVESWQVQYAGLVPIELDGARQQVVYSVGLQGATTIAGYNNEQTTFGSTFRERRQVERQKAIETTVKLLAAEGIV